MTIYNGFFENYRDGLKQIGPNFVGLKNCEVQHIRLENRSGAERSLRLTAAVEWCLWNTVDDSTNFQRNLNIAELELEDNVIYHKTEYRERRDHYAYYGVNSPIAGYDTDRDSFLGCFGSFAAPQAILNCKCGNFIALGGEPMAGLTLELTLMPGEAKDYVFVLGYGQNPRDKKFLSRRYPQGHRKARHGPLCRCFGGQLRHGGAQGVLGFTAWKFPAQLRR